MRIRRKPPSLVSMWMLDVFCCALGCVTFLWLINTRLASDEKTRAAVALADLKQTRATLLSTVTLADATYKALTADIDNLKAKLVATTTEKDDLAKQLAVANTDLTSAQSKLAKSESTLAKSEEELAKKKKAATDLTLKLADAVAAREEIDKLLREKETASAALMAKMKTAEEQLHDLDAKHLALTKENAEATKNLAAMKKTGDELGTARATIKDLQKKIDDSNATIIDLQGDKAKLADKFDKLRIESEAKFAGIAMTGRRVVFLVDTSGSMKLLDDKTPAPQKWPTVCDTVVKVMRSLPNLEHFQIVTFAGKAKYHFPGGEWQKYDGEATLKKVKESLLAIDPDLDTNMYDAFDLAFRLKPGGLDTIYLFSDGLPTSGPGLTAEQERTFTAAQKNDLLTRQLRTTLAQQWNPAGARHVRINSIGFFFESPEVGAFLWALSRDHDGSFVGMSKP